MRNVAKGFTNQKLITVKEFSEHAILTPITENKSERYVDVTVRYVDSSGDEVGVESFKIDGEKYDLLMADKPEFNPSKPVNEYYEDDLWYVLRLIDPSLPEK